MIQGGGSRGMESTPEVDMSAASGWHSRITAFGIVLLAVVIGARPAAAQDLDAQPAGLPQPTDVSATTGTPALPSALGEEARRYLTDGGQILLAPFHWDGKSWTQAALAVAAIALISQEDKPIDAAFQRNRSAQTDSFSTAIRPFGTYGAIGLSFASLGAGLIFKNAEWRDTGRDAIEAELFAAGIATPVLKATAGRLRPSQGSDADEFRPLSGSQSFPSGESTEAFAFASVVAARSRGWVLPVVAYAAASGVALARLNAHAHFASDVVAGAFIGTAIGHSVVRRHSPEKEGAVSWTLVPIAAARGTATGIGIRLQTGGP